MMVLWGITTPTPPFDKEQCCGDFMPEFLIFVL